MTAARSAAARFAAGMLDRTMITLIERCAPEIPLLARNEVLPDAQVHTLLDWAAQLRSEDPLAAFTLQEMPKVLAALNVAFLSCCSISRAPDGDRPPPPGRVDLELRDNGGAVLVRMTRAAACVATAAIHGDAGVALVRDANAKLHAMLDQISARIAQMD